MLKTFAVIRKTYPPRKTPRGSYIFLLKLDTWQANCHALERAATNGGPKYELLDTVQGERKSDILKKVCDMYPNERVENREVY
jgi:hypothetical protein